MDTKDDPDASDGIHLASGRISDRAGKLIGELTVKPQDQGRLLLGDYTAVHNLKGFSIQLTPKPDPDNAVVAQIANAGTPRHYKLLLHVINYGTKTVTATIWQL
jgi:hypothetical protein